MQYSLRVDSLNNFDSISLLCFRKAEITLYELDEQAVEQCIEFCYTGTIHVDETSVQTLLPAASMLQIDAVFAIVTLCSAFRDSQ